MNLHVWHNIIIIHNKYLWALHGTIMVHYLYTVRCFKKKKKSTSYTSMIIFYEFKNKRLVFNLAFLLNFVLLWFSSCFSEVTHELNMLQKKKKKFNWSNVNGLQNSISHVFVSICTFRVHVVKRFRDNVKTNRIWYTNLYDYVGYINYWWKYNLKIHEIFTAIYYTSYWFLIIIKKIVNHLNWEKYHFSYWLFVIIVFSTTPYAWNQLIVDERLRRFYVSRMCF